MLYIANYLKNSSLTEEIEKKYNNGIKKITEKLNEEKDNFIKETNWIIKKVESKFKIKKSKTTLEGITFFLEIELDDLYANDELNDLTPHYTWKKKGGFSGIYEVSIGRISTGFFPVGSNKLLKK